MKIRKAAAAVLVFAVMLLCGCGKEKLEDEWVLAQEDAVILADGTAVDRWEQQYITDDLYKLRDGTALLREQDYIHVENVTGGGSDGYDQLNETAQAAISAYYDAQPLFYDLKEQLELAYEEYLADTEQGKTYDCRMVSQEECPTASNDHIICIRTEAYIPKGDSVYYSLWENAVFDRETGEKIVVWDLFTVPEEQVRERLLKAIALGDEQLYREMETALKPEYITFCEGGLEVMFPEGTLPSQEYATGGGFDIEEVDDILQDWAIIEESQ